MQLREKREELNKSIAADEEEKGACALRQIFLVPILFLAHERPP